MNGGPWPRQRQFASVFGDRPNRPAASTLSTTTDALGAEADMSSGPLLEIAGALLMVAARRLVLFARCIFDRSQPRIVTSEWYLSAARSNRSPQGLRRDHGGIGLLRIWFGPHRQVVSDHHAIYNVAVCSCPWSAVSSHSHHVDCVMTNCYRAYGKEGHEIRRLAVIVVGGFWRWNGAQFLGLSNDL